jgi:multidrug efflux pump subunit AcrA (membrane-fusion protein)
MKKLISKYPLIIFLLLLALLFTVIFVGKKMRSQETEKVAKKEITKTVEIFDTSKKLQAPITGEVDRADTIILRATANGIVTRTLKAGDKVYRGKEIVKLSDTYSGSSQAGAAAAVAQRNAQFQNETSDTQRDILKAQKKDLKRTKDKQARIAWKQHYIQERSIELAHDTAQLQASQAYASVALFRTVAPLTGQLEEVTVKVGDYVQAGKVLAVLKADKADNINLTAHIGAERAMHIDVEATVTAIYKDKTIPLEIVHLSQNGTGSQSYTLTFQVDKNIIGNVDDGSFLEINLPLKSEDDILIPLDSVHFSTDSAEVYVVSRADGEASKAGLLERNNSEAKSLTSSEPAKNTYTARLKTITLGDVVGSYIIVTEGLEKNTKIIMDRNVTDGEKVEF